MSNEPGFRSLPSSRRSGDWWIPAEGYRRIYFGENYREWIDMAEGNFVFVPPHMPHVEVNMSVTEEIVWVTCRTPDNLVVNLPDMLDKTLERFRRA